MLRWVTRSRGREIALASCVHGKRPFLQLYSPPSSHTIMMRLKSDLSESENEMGLVCFS